MKLLCLPGLLLFCVHCVHAQSYHVRKITPGTVSIDGKGSAAAWEKAGLLTDFTYPWDTAAAPATSFAALWDGQWLYCLYRVKDDSVITLVRQNDKMEVGASDRVEIFLKQDDVMNPYYCLELDADGRILDYQAFYYRKMNFLWSWPAGGLKVKASRVRDGYTVAFAISISSLQALGLLQNNRLQAGLFRAECKGMLNGSADLRWISWIMPKSDEPDFHIPAAFGELVLE
jgi:hypothetical protein